MGGKKLKSPHQCSVNSSSHSPLLLRCVSCCLPLYLEAKVLCRDKVAVGCRGHARNNDKDQVLEKKARLDAESRRQVMLSPDALKKELHCWVAHDSRWLTFKSWIEVPPPNAVSTLVCFTVFQRYTWVACMYAECLLLRAAKRTLKSTLYM
jgi:hypothetical protein